MSAIEGKQADFREIDEFTSKQGIVMSRFSDKQGLRGSKAFRLVAWLSSANPAGAALRAASLTRLTR